MAPHGSPWPARCLPGRPFAAPAPLGAPATESASSSSSSSGHACCTACSSAEPSSATHVEARVRTPSLPFYLHVRELEYPSNPKYKA